ncbi:glycine cleavage system protein GcvH [bacterium]|nr:glycine cleavage system protein GcvH [bacterium]
MNIPNNLLYTKDHEWVKLEENEALIGITDYAQSELGDIVFIELPEIGSNIITNEAFGAVEAVKAAADLFAPICGEVVAVNGLLDQQPELINQSPYEEGWIIRISLKDLEEIDTLIKPVDYQSIIDDIRGE